MIPWPFTRKREAPPPPSASDHGRELAILGAAQRRLERRRRVLLKAELLRRSGAKSPIRPRELIVAGIREARRSNNHPAALTANLEGK